MTNLAEADLAAAPPVRPAPCDSEAPALVRRLVCGEALATRDAETLFASLLAGDLNDSDMAAMLVALKMRGETDAEMIGACRALAAAALPFDRPAYTFADSCGTGGDNSGSINISTATALVAASCGLPVAKHGNRSVSSRCGSADVLERLGVRLEITPHKARALLDDTGFCFLFAPHYHRGLAQAAAVRRRLGVPTIMNQLGPCLNPARPPVQLIGVSNPAAMPNIASTAAAMGVERALIVHGDGLDELALHAPSRGLLCIGGEVCGVELMPEDAGLARRPLPSITALSPEDNAARLRALLEGEAPDTADHDIVVLNCAALLWTAGRAATLREGAEMARSALATGAPYERLRAYAEASHD